MNESGSKSKKRSDASSKSKPPEPLVLFLDRSLGKHVIATALRQSGIQVRVHDDYFPQNAKDEEWLPVVGERGWIVLTKDRKLRYRTPALAAVREARVRLFALTGKDIQASEMAQVILKALPAIERLTAQERPPIIAKITKGGAVSVWVARRELMRRRP